MQERLFPIDNIPTREQEPDYEHPLFEAIGISPDTFKGAERFAKVVIKEGSKYYEVGRDIKSTWSDYYQDEVDNTIFWSKSPLHDREFSGFIICGTTASNGETILHLFLDITDSDSSVAVRVEDVESIWLYSENASKVMAMYQNAQVDGVNHGFTEEQLEAFVDMYWPEPELVYENPIVE